jgi:hypothetical protein
VYRSVLVLSPATMLTIRASPSRENVSFTAVTVPLLAVLRPSATSVFRTHAALIAIVPSAVSVVVDRPGR